MIVPDARWPFFLKYQQVKAPRGVCGAWLRIGKNLMQPSLVGTLKKKAIGYHDIGVCPLLVTFQVFFFSCAFFVFTL